jgi:hypothetical protein
MTSTSYPVDATQWPLSIGVDIGGTQMRVAVLQGSTLISRVGMLTGMDTAPERMMPRIANEAIDNGQGAELLVFAGAMLAHPSSAPDQSALPAPLDLNTQPLDPALAAGVLGNSGELGEKEEALGVGLVNILHVFNPRIPTRGIPTCSHAPPPHLVSRGWWHG